MTGVSNTLGNVAYGVLASTDELKHPLLRRLLQDWQSAPATNGLPDHGFADPLKLGYLLGQLLIVDVRQVHGRLRFHYRLIGTDLVARLQKDYTGHWMDEHQDAAIATTGTDACRLAVETRQPVRVTATRYIDGGRYAIEYLLLPLADRTSSQIDRLVIAQLYPANAPRLPYRSER